MKKTYFMRIYYWIRFQMKIAILFLILALLALFFSIPLLVNVTNFPVFLPILYVSVIILDILKAGLIAISTMLLTLLLLEIINRLKKDSLLNFWKSVVGTFRFQQFLKQSQALPANNSSEQSQAGNIITTRFNQTVRKSVLDISEERLLLYIKIPKTAQAQKMLKEHEEQIKEHIASYYPDYIVSPFERQKSVLWLIGTKRK